MTTCDVAAHLNARRIGPARWKARCPAHEDRSPSLDIAGGDDGRTLLLCRAGCPTPNVLRAAGLTWIDLFPQRAWASCRPGHFHRRVDPPVARQQRAERKLREWAEKTGRRIRDEVHARHRAVTVGEQLIATGDERGWELLAVAYHGLAEREWLLDLLESRRPVASDVRPADWLRARRYLEEEKND